MFLLKKYTRNQIPFDHPFELNLACRSIKGWPRILLEVWTTDEHNRNALAGYGLQTIPFTSSNTTMTVRCWRPSKNAFSEKLLNNNPEFLDTTAVYSNDDKIALQTISSGEVNIELDILLKDFHLHGVVV